MDDEPTTPDTGRVSFDKREAADTSARVSRTRGRKPALTADGSPMPPPPPSVRYAAIALAVSAVASLVASLSLFGEKGWLLSQATKSNAKLKNKKTPAELHDAVNTTVHSSLLVTVVLLIALAFAARGVLLGRHWARWTVIGLWVLATLTGTFAGINYLVGIVSSEPVAFKIPSFVAALALLAAAVFVYVKPSAQHFALSRPPRPDAAAGGPARRGGLFGPRPARPGFNTPKDTTSNDATPAPARSGAARDTGERSRSKQRASSESVAKGAELARARAKASKSRRTGV